jgi:hypothetical protein
MECLPKNKSTDAMTCISRNGRKNIRAFVANYNGKQKTENQLTTKD